MDTRKTRELPAGLERLRKRLERWRQTRKPRSRIPDPVWAAAVTVAKTYGINRTRGRCGSPITRSKNGLTGKRLRPPGSQIRGHDTSFGRIGNDSIPMSHNWYCVTRFDSSIC